MRTKPFMTPTPNDMNAGSVKTGKIENEKNRKNENTMTSREAEKPKTELKRWWRYAVLRGKGLPQSIDGWWYDLDSMTDFDGWPVEMKGINFEATNEWERRDDGEVAVVYRPIGYTP
jgi:hypothetical protein